MLRLHVEAVWGVQLPRLLSDNVELLPDSSQPSWRLCAADIVDGRVYIWRPDVQATEREALRLRVDEGMNSSIAQTEVSREFALSLVTSPHIDISKARTIARPLTEEDGLLIEKFQPSSLDYYFHPARQPLMGVVVNERLVSLAHSSRRTTEACELGIDTLSQARRRGYALAATILWANAVLQEGLVPLYSAFASNTASLRLAAAAGYRPFAQVVLFDS